MCVEWQSEHEKMLFRNLRRRSPRFRKRFWRTWYDLMAVTVPRADWTFMNYGWKSPAGDAPRDSAPTAAGYAQALYLRTAGAVSLSNREVVEVGCGRGGGAEAVLANLGPARVLGVDFSPRAIAFCRRVHRTSGLEFVVGDAESLPLADESADVILSVETTHCYRSTPAFLAQARRVLRPGGHLLLADFRDAASLPDFLEAIATCGLQRIEEEDITAGVVAALDAAHGDKVERVERLVPAPLRKVVLSFAATRDSETYRDFHSGAKSYLRFVLRKP